MQIIENGKLAEENPTENPTENNFEKLVQSLPRAPKTEAYRLQVGDTMDIKVRFNSELDEQVIVPPDGIISTSMAEDVLAYGRTVKEFRKALKKQYAHELKNPRISVILRSFAPNRIYVTGEVKSAGEFVTIGPSLTLLQAIARAGGLKDSASTSDIIIIRHGDGGKAMAYAVDYEAAASGESPENDAQLSAYDVVFVPRSGIANVYNYFQQFVQQFLPAAFGFSYQINPQNTVAR